MYVYMYNCILFLAVFFNVYIFTLRERERKSTSRGGVKREERDRILSRIHAVSTKPNADAGLEPTDHEIMT